MKGNIGILAFIKFDEFQTLLKLENYGFGFLPISLSSLSLVMVLVIIPRFNHCSSYHIPPSTIAPTKRSHSKRSRYKLGVGSPWPKPNEQIELIIGLNIFTTFALDVSLCLICL